MRPPLQLVLFQLVVGFFLIPALCEATSKSVSFELFHRHHPELSGRIPAPQNHRERVQELVSSDSLRHRWISLKRNRSIRWRASEASGTDGAIQMRMGSGASAGTGQYFVTFRVGTPPQKFFLVADTGSHVTWMNCRYRCRKSMRNRRSRGRRIFRADDSSSFAPIGCASTMCMTTLPDATTNCPTPTSPCSYQYWYEDGSESRGIYANETATIFHPNGGKIELKGFVIGCSSSFVGSSFRVADGILGLGHGGNSFVDVALQHFGGKFSYCLVDHLSPRDVSNYLTFGQFPQSNQPMTYTILIANQKNEPFYSLEVQGISVGGVLLKIPPAVWDVSGAGGAIMDSGTSLTMLAVPAFEAVLPPLKEPLKGFKQIQINPFDFCFDATTGFTEDLVPKLVFHLSGSVRFEPPVKNYVIDVDDGVKCIAIVSAPWPGTSIIGNILQQEHLWEFDYWNGRLGFRPSTCVSSSD